MTLRARTWQSIYPETTVQFDSRYDLQASIRRVAERTQPSVLRTLIREAAVGRVDAAEVRLRRYSPWFRNDFAPCFVGAFEIAAGHLVLRGCFRASGWTGAFLTSWLGLGTMRTLAATMAAVRGPAPWTLPLVGLLMLAFGLVLVTLGRRFGSADVEWLTRVVQHALGSGDQGSAGAAVSARRGRVPPDAASADRR
jgi:xanthosine utilization system XapX-like protein